MREETLELAEEDYKFGFETTYNGDKNKVLYCTTCNHCGEYFESERLDVYCDKCKTVGWLQY